MSAELLLPVLLSLLPVLAFLGLLLFLDSYKLVSMTTVVALIGVGLLAAGASYVANGWLMRRLGLDLRPFTRYVSPLVEEALKALVIVGLIRRHRIGFLIDASIAGFAVGCGFALVENLWALWRLPDAALTTWVVRGFGTAIMHGGASAGFALITLAILERDERRSLRALLPGFAFAVLLHSAFNHLAAQPQIATLVGLVLVPALLLAAFHHGERSLGDWIGRGFDADTELLALMRSGGLPDSPAGHYLATLKLRFSGPVLVDLICYLRLFTELALRAKGVLLMRENGFEAGLDAATRAKFDELRFLERSIGPTGLLALRPLQPMRRKALRQVYLI